MTPQQLIDCGVHPTQARLFAQPLTATFARFDIATPLRQAAFLAQCMHESTSFTVLEESLWYRSPEKIASAFARLTKAPDLAELCRNPEGLAAAAYCNRNGNAGAASEDGWLFRGSGVIQLTGRTNFERAAKDTGRPYLQHPELVRTNPDDAVLTAGLYWRWNNCNQIVEEGDFDGLSKLINLGNRNSKGTPNGNLARRALFDQVLEALHNAPPAMQPRLPA